jgi:hypothetical protein
LILDSKHHCISVAPLPSVISGGFFMKNFGKLAVLGAVLAASAPLAFASSINANVNVNGFDSFTSSTITFQSPITAFGEINTAVPTSYSGNILVANVAIPYTPGGVVSPALNFAVLDGFNFYVTSESFANSTSVIGGTLFDVLELKGTGYFSGAGYDDTNATFDLTSQEVAGSTSATIGGSFSASSATSSPTPEPSSLILLGSGLLSGAGMLMRKRRTV